MREILLIVKKELRRIFGDRRLVFTTFLLPALSIAILYGFMGTMMQGMFDERDQYLPRIVVIAAPESFSETVDEEVARWVFEKGQVEGRKEELRSGLIDALLVFPGDFDRPDVVPDLALYHNDAEEHSLDAKRLLEREVLPTYKTHWIAEKVKDARIAQAFTINESVDEEERRLVDVQKATGKGLSMLLPLLISLFLFAGAMGVGADMLAGEKERHTMATLLMTPIKREVIAYGKLISLGIIALCSALSSFVGVLVSMPFASVLFSASGDAVDLSALGFGMSEYGTLLLLLFLLAGLYASVICVISLMANTVKEANTYMAPVYMLVLLAGFSTLYSDASSVFSFGLPVLGNVQAIKALLIFELEPIMLLVNVASTLVAIGLMALLMRVLFERETVLFGD